MSNSNARKRFVVVLIHPSRYDDDGYVIQWFRSWMPSNTLAVLNGLAVDAAERKVLGDDVQIEIDAYDESNTVVPVGKIIRRIRSAGGRGLVCLVGVQSSQFPRAVDIARPLRAAGIAVAIGGFHVSGCMRMLPEMPTDLKDAMAMGITLFAGEAEGRFGALLADAYHGRLREIYNYLAEPPCLEGAPTPIARPDMLRGTLGVWATLDASRGCPFNCTFCTIINVQGRKVRSRSVDDVEQTVRAYYRQGVSRFFFTDDNFARNPDWEKILDRLIELREREGIELSLIVQVDAAAHKIPRLIYKLATAGCKRIFIGLESVSPENLASAGKGQNHVKQYREMLQAWHDVCIMTQAGYIVGFPFDTPESIERDVEVLKKELPLHLVKFACLMPLPGSVDHRNKLLGGEWMDPDMNRYNGEKVVSDHPRMSRTEWEAAFWRAWEQYYSDEHVGTILRRCETNGPKSLRVLTQVVGDILLGRYERVQPLEGGLFRRKVRTQRRFGMKRENPLVFYPRRLWEILSCYLPAAWHIVRLVRLRWRIKYHEKPIWQLPAEPAGVGADADLATQMQRSSVPHGSFAAEPEPLHDPSVGRQLVDLRHAA
jgi:hypothetical protein